MKISQKLLHQSIQIPKGHFTKRSILTDIVKRPDQRPDDLPGLGRVGAVMILIYDKHDDSFLVLTKRQSHLKHHAGQISLPGGKQDPDESLMQTAVRETEEELGVLGSELELIGNLASVYIPPSDFTIHPFVAWHPDGVEFHKSDAEVAEVIEVPIKHLLASNSLKKGRLQSGQTDRDVDFFDVMGHQVWGATAIVLCDFVDRIRSQISENSDFTR